MNKFLLLIFALLVFWGCSDSSSDPDDDYTYKIGVLLPMTGSGSSTGESVKAALEYANLFKLEIVQNDNNIDYEVELIYEDTETNPDVALEKLKKLKAEGINIVIGPYSSKSVANLIDYAVANDMVMLSYSAVAISLEARDDNFLRLVPSDKYQAQAIDKLFAYENISHLASVYVNDVWGSDLQSKVKELFAKQAGNNDIEYEYSETSEISDVMSNLNTSVANLLSGTDADRIGTQLISFGEGTDALAYASDYDNLQNIKWFGASAFAENKDLLNNEKAVQFAVNTNFRCTVFDAGVKDGSIMTYLTGELGRTPEEYAYVAYDAYNLAVRSLIEYDKDKSVNLEGVVYNTAKNMTGITGKLEMNEFGDRIGGNYRIMNIVKNGNNYEWNQWGYYNYELDEINPD
jgi:ABC-type branched-subunit amino acid transport system substrate-binding protein